MGEDLKEILDNQNLSDEEVARLLQEKYERANTNHNISGKADLFEKLDNDPQMTDAALQLLSYDLDKLDEIFGFLLDKYNMTEEDLIDYAKYKREQYGILDEHHITKEKTDTKTLNKEHSNKRPGYDTISTLYGVDNVNKPGYDTIASLYGVDKRKPSNEDPVKSNNVNDSSEEIFNIDDRISEIDKEKFILMAKRKALRKEYSEILDRLKELKKIVMDAIDNNELIPDEVVEEKDRLFDRKRVIKQQISIFRKPKRTVKEEQEKEHEEEKAQKEEEEENEITGVRDGSFLSKAKGFVDKIKNLSTKGKIIGVAGLVATGLITGGVYMAIKHGDSQMLNDALHQAGMHVQDAANQLHPHEIDPSTISQHIDATFVSNNDAANRVNLLTPDERYFQYNIQNEVDSHNNITPVPDMSYDELIEHIKNGNDITSVQVGGDAAHIDGHLRVDDILNAYDAAVKSGGAVR